MLSDKKCNLSAHLSQSVPDLWDANAECNSVQECQTQARLARLTDAADVVCSRCLAHSVAPE